VQGVGLFGGFVVANQGNPQSVALTEVSNFQYFE
jgi:hypothetical protein